MSIFCKICNKECKHINGLSVHIVKLHKITTKEYYDKYFKKENEGICSICGKETTFIDLGKGYREFCSVICLGKSEKVKEKIQQTCISKYNVKSIAQSDIIKEKKKQTNLKKYGVENIFQSETVKNKIRKTNFEKYGVEYYFKTDDCKQKTKETNLQRYGVEYYTQTEEYNIKSKQTCLEKYGVEYYNQTDEWKEKSKNTCLEKYGVEYYSQTDEWKEKAKNTCLEKYGSECYSKTNDFREKKKEEIIEKYKKEFSFLNIIDYNINDSIMTCYCNECNKNYNIGIMMLGSRLRHLKYRNPCTNCFPINGQYSNKEKELVDYIKSIYDGEIIENDRNILKPLEIDIYLPELKLAFEYNGLYWHSIENKPYDYHINKTIECENRGIQLVHIFENDWFFNIVLLKNYINDLLFTNDNILNNSLVFNKTSNDTITVNRSLNNGKILEKYNYKLNEILSPEKQIISFNNIEYNVYNCGYLKYIKV